MDRVVDGFPGWMVDALGDAACPVITEWLARRILEVEAER